MVFIGGGVGVWGLAKAARRSFAARSLVDSSKVIPVAEDPDPAPEVEPHEDEPGLPQADCCGGADGPSP